MTSGGPLEARRGQKRPGRSEEARKRLEEHQKMPGRSQKGPEGQESRIWPKTARNAMFYEQKMTFLGPLNFGDFGESRRRPKRGQKRPGRGPEEAGRRLEEARNRPEE